MLDFSSFAIKQSLEEIQTERSVPLPKITNENFKSM